MFDSFSGIAAHFITTGNDRQRQSAVADKKNGNEFVSVL
jgi:hypothetical protein